MTATRIQDFVNTFQTVFEGEPWFGDSIQTKLQDVSEAQAMTQPAGQHSIAELVAHMTYWRQTLIHKLAGDRDWKASMESDDNWPSMERLKDKGWDRIREEFAHSQQALTEGLAAKEDTFLDSPFGKTSTFEQLVQGITQHDIYHLGQIGLIKKMTS